MKAEPEISAEDAKHLQMQLVNRAEIIEAFGVPPHLLNSEKPASTPPSDI
jgi:capsid portal protein